MRAFLCTLIAFVTITSSWGFHSIHNRHPVRFGRNDDLTDVFGAMKRLNYKKPTAGADQDEISSTRKDSQLRDGAYYPASDTKSTVQKVFDFYEDNVAKEGYNGFTEISELINGRLAMVGLACGYIKEYYTGETLLQQIGIGVAPFETLKEITADWGALVGVSIFIVTLSIFNHAPPSIKATSDGE